MRRLELYQSFGSDLEAIAWCREKGLLRLSALCPSCGESMREMPSNSGDGVMWRCSKMVGGRRHFKSVSIREQSVFAGSRLSIRVCVYLLYEWSVATSLQQSAFQMDINERTAIKHYKLFREIAAWRVSTMQDGQIGGDGSIVEVDECQLGRRKAHRGRVPRELWVVGGLLRNSNPPRIFIEVVRKRNSRTLLPLLQRRIHIDSHIITDGWASYGGLSELGYRHSVVNHSLNFVNPEDAEIHTQGIENVWCCLRRFLRLKGTYTRRNLNGYLLEFLFRKTYCDVFESMLSAIEARYRF